MAVAFKIKLAPLVFILSLTFVASSCKKKEDPEPEKTSTSCFTPSTYFVPVNGVVVFSNCSKDYDRVEWNFGDGESSTLTEPSHKFEKKGWADVVLTTFKGSKSAKSSCKIVIGQNALVSFSLTATSTYTNSKYESYGYKASLYKSDDFSKSLSYAYISLGKPNPSVSGNGNLVINENANFKIIFRLLGFYNTGSQSQGETVDSVITGEFGTFTDTKSQVKTVNISSTTLSYTVGQVFF